MARTAAAFRQSDVTRAVKAAVAAGVKIARVEIEPDGRIAIVAVGEAVAEPATDFDRWKASRATRQAI